MRVDQDFLKPPAPDNLFRLIQKRGVQRLGSLALAFVLTGVTLVLPEPSASVDSSSTASQTTDKVLFRANFAEWPVMDGDGECGDQRYYDESDGYHILVNCGAREYGNRVNPLFDDFDYRVTATKVDGSNFVHYGINASDISKYLQRKYSFFINGRGGYLLMKYTLDTEYPEDLKQIQPEILTQSILSSVVRRDNSSNDLGMVRVGDSFQISLNGEIVYEDELDTSGHQMSLGISALIPQVIDIFTGQSLEQTADIAFRDLVVREP